MGHPPKLLSKFLGLKEEVQRVPPTFQKLNSYTKISNEFLIENPFRKHHIPQLVPISKTLRI